MQRLAARYLADGKGFNRGQPAFLLRIESPADYARLEEALAARGYYDRSYLAGRLGCAERRLKPDDVRAAALLALLEPADLLELGCGRGDLLFLLHLAGARRLRGTDLSPALRAAAWPAAAGLIDVGDLAASLLEYQQSGRRFATFAGLDIWEHLSPTRLPAIAAALAGLAREEALFFFVIPAVGEDPVFGEIFPLEFAENRRCLAEGRPFDHLLADAAWPDLPAGGHLTLAGSAWWQQLFAKAGLVRLPEAERELHRLFDDILFPARRSFFLFALDAPAARARGERLASRLARRPTRFQPLARLQRALRAREEAAGTALCARQTLEADLRQCWLKRAGIGDARGGPLARRALRRARLRLADLAWHVYRALAL